MFAESAHIHVTNRMYESGSAICCFFAFVRVRGRLRMHIGVYTVIRSTTNSRAKTDGRYQSIRVRYMFVCSYVCVNMNRNASA